MRNAVLLASLFIAAPAWAQEYRSPIEPPASGTAPYVTAYRDLSGGGGIQDWNCGTNAYNGHRGTDIGIGGFPVMDSGSRWVVAGADGDVATAIDGCFDRCTTGRCDCGAGFGNYVKVTHVDGKSTFYGHLLNGSVQVSVGDKVTCGQRLGKVGSSGNSTGPHLHFEPRYSNNVSDDPFSGPCGGPISFWVAQGNYNALPDTMCMGGTPTPDTATIKGVVWDRSVTDTPSANGNLRIPGTTVAIDGGASTTARAVDAYWQFVVAPGTYRVVFSQPGYTDDEQTITVMAEENRWASIGLLPEGGTPPARDDAILLVGPMLVEVEPNEVFDLSWTVQNTGSTVWSDPEVEVGFDRGYDFGAAEVMRFAVGEAIAPGAEKKWTLTLTASAAEGSYDGTWRMRRVGATEFGPRFDVSALVVTATVADPDPDPDPDPMIDPDPEDDIKTPPEIRATGKKIQGSCGCTTGARRAERAWGAWLLLLFGLRAAGRRRFARGTASDPSARASR